MGKQSNGKPEARPEAPVSVASWQPIVDDYVAARNALWGWDAPGSRCKGVGDAWYLLLGAYRMARDAKEKDHLWYARILYMMATQGEGKLGDWHILKSYAEPCLEEYEQAVGEGRVAADAREIDVARDVHERLSRRVERSRYYSFHRVEALSLIDGLEDPDDFWFEDGLILEPKLVGDVVTFGFDNEGEVSEFRCEGVTEFFVDIDVPDMSWVSECELYPYDPATGEGASRWTSGSSGSYANGSRSLRRGLSGHDELAWHDGHEEAARPRRLGARSRCWNPSCAQ